MFDEIRAKPIIDEKFWIIESKNGTKIGVLKTTEQHKYVISCKDSIKTFDSKNMLIDQFGKNFFIVDNKKSTTTTNEIYGYPTTTTPHNPLFDVQRHLPLFTKNIKSKSVFCAGYYIVKFEKGWVKSFCPKLITLERYPFEGPFKTELEMKQKLSHVSREN